jgi:hypothetical protein
MGGSNSKIGGYPFAYTTEPTSLPLYSPHEADTGYSTTEAWAQRNPEEIVQDKEWFGGRSTLLTKPDGDVTLEEIDVYLKDAPKNMTYDTKTKLLKHIASAVKGLNMKVDTRNNETIVESLKSVLPNPEKDTFSGNYSHLDKIARAIATALNKEFSIEGHPIISLDQPTNQVVKEVAQHIYGISCGMQEEFYKIYNVLKRQHNRLDALIGVAEQILKDYSAKLEAGTESPEARIQLETMKEGITASLAQLKDTANILRAVTGNLAKDEDKIKAEIYKHKDAFGRVTEYTTSPPEGEDEYGTVLARLLSTVGNTAVLTHQVNEALKRAGMTMKDYKSFKSVPDLLADINKKIEKLDPSKQSEDVINMLQASDELARFFAHRDKVKGGRVFKDEFNPGGIANDEGSSGMILGGGCGCNGDTLDLNMEEVSVSTGTSSTPSGGSVSGWQNRSNAQEDLQDQVFLGGQEFLTDKEYEQRERVRKEGARMALQAFVRKVNTDIDETYDDLVDVSVLIAQESSIDLEMLEDIIARLESLDQLRDPNVYLALVGYYLDETYRERSQLFRDNMNNLVVKLRQYPGSEKVKTFFNKIAQHVVNIIKEIDRFSDLLKSVFAKVPKLDVIEVISDTPGTINSIDLARRKLIHALYVSRLRTSMKENASELKVYSKEYANMVSLAIGEKRRQLAQENEFVLAQGSGLMYDKYKDQNITVGGNEYAIKNIYNLYNVIAEAKKAGTWFNTEYKLYDKALGSQATIPVIAGYITPSQMPASGSTYYTIKPDQTSNFPTNFDPNAANAPPALGGDDPSYGNLTTMNAANPAMVQQLGNMLNKILTVKGTKDYRARAVAFAVQMSSFDNAGVKTQQSTEGSISRLYNKFYDDALKLDVQSDAQEQHLLMRDLIKDEYRAKDRLYKALESLDILLTHFTEAAVTDPDILKQLKKFTEDTKVYTKWFTDYTGNSLTKIFESMPAYENGCAGYNGTEPQRHGQDGNISVARFIIEQPAGAPAVSQYLQPAAPDNLPPYCDAELNGDLSNDFDPYLGAGPYEFHTSGLATTLDQSQYYKALQERLSKSANKNTYGKATGVAPIKSLKAIRKAIDLYYNNFQALKNIFHAFIVLYDHLSVNKAQGISNLMSPSQIYASILSYLKASAVARKYYLNCGIPQRSNYKTKIFGVVLPAYYPKPENNSEGYDPASINTQEANALNKYEGTIGTYKRQIDQHYRSVYEDEDKQCALAIKAVTGSILTTVGLLYIQSQPANTGIVSSMRAMVGGNKRGGAGANALADEQEFFADVALTQPPVLKQGYEIYYYIPRIAEFYRLIFQKQESLKDAADRWMTMPKDLVGSFAKTIYIIFNKTGDSPVYTDLEVRAIINELNKAYNMYKDSKDAVRDVIKSFIREVNRRFSVVSDKKLRQRLAQFEERLKKAELDKYVQPDTTGELPFPGQTQYDNDTKYLDSLPAPSDALAHSGFMFTPTAEALARQGQQLTPAQQQQRYVSKLDVGGTSFLPSGSTVEQQEKWLALERVRLLRASIDDQFDILLRKPDGTYKQGYETYDLYKQGFYGKLMKNIGNKLDILDVPADRFMIANDLIQGNVQSELSEDQVNLTLSEVVATPCAILFSNLNLLQATLNDIAVYEPTTFMQIASTPGSSSDNCQVISDKLIAGLEAYLAKKLPNPPSGTSASDIVTGWFLAQMQQQPAQAAQVAINDINTINNLLFGANFVNNDRYKAFKKLFEVDLGITLPDNRVIAGAGVDDVGYTYLISLAAANAVRIRPTPMPNNPTYPLDYDTVPGAGAAFNIDDARFVKSVFLHTIFSPWLRNLDAARFTPPADTLLKPLEYPGLLSTSGDFYVRVCYELMNSTHALHALGVGYALKPGTTSSTIGWRDTFERVFGRDVSIFKTFTNVVGSTASLFSESVMDKQAELERRRKEYIVRQCISSLDQTPIFTAMMGSLCRLNSTLGELVAVNISPRGINLDLTKLQETCRQTLVAIKKNIEILRRKADKEALSRYDLSNNPYSVYAMEKIYNRMFLPYYENQVRYPALLTRVNDQLNVTYRSLFSQDPTRVIMGGAPGPISYLQVNQLPANNYTAQMFVSAIMPPHNELTALNQGDIIPTMKDQVWALTGIGKSAVQLFALLGQAYAGKPAMPENKYAQTSILRGLSNTSNISSLFPALNYGIREMLTTFFEMGNKKIYAGIINKLMQTRISSLVENPSLAYPDFLDIKSKEAIEALATLRAGQGDVSGKSEYVHYSLPTPDAILTFSTAVLIKQIYSSMDERTSTPLYMYTSLHDAGNRATLENYRVKMPMFAEYFRSLSYKCAILRAILSRGMVNKKLVGETVLPLARAVPTSGSASDKCNHYVLFAEPDPVKGNDRLGSLNGLRTGKLAPLSNAMRAANTPAQWWNAAPSWFNRAQPAQAPSRYLPGLMYPGLFGGAGNVLPAQWDAFMSDTTKNRGWSSNPATYDNVPTNMANNDKVGAFKNLPADWTYLNTPIDMVAVYSTAKDGSTPQRILNEYNIRAPREVNQTVIRRALDMILSRNQAIQTLYNQSGPGVKERVLQAIKGFIEDNTLTLPMGRIDDPNNPTNNRQGILNLFTDMKNAGFALTQAMENSIIGMNENQFKTLIKGIPTYIDQRLPITASVYGGASLGTNDVIVPGIMSATQIDRPIDPKDRNSSLSTGSRLIALWASTMGTLQAGTYNNYISKTNNAMYSTVLEAASTDGIYLAKGFITDKQFYANYNADERYLYFGQMITNIEEVCQAMVKMCEGIARELPIEQTYMDVAESFTAKLMPGVGVGAANMGPFAPLSLMSIYSAPTPMSKDLHSLTTLVNTNEFKLQNASLSLMYGRDMSKIVNDKYMASPLSILDTYNKGAGITRIDKPDYMTLVKNLVLLSRFNYSLLGHPTSVFRGGLYASSGFVGGADTSVGSMHPLIDVSGRSNEYVLQQLANDSSYETVLLNADWKDLSTRNAQDFVNLNMSRVLDAYKGRTPAASMQQSLRQKQMTNMLGDDTMNAFVRSFEGTESITKLNEEELNKLEQLLSQVVPIFGGATDDINADPNKMWDGYNSKMRWFVAYMIIFEQLIAQMVNRPANQDNAWTYNSMANDRIKNIFEKLVDKLHACYQKCLYDPNYGDRLPCIMINKPSDIIARPFHAYKNMTAEEANRIVPNAPDEHIFNPYDQYNYIFTAMNDNKNRINTYGNTISGRYDVRSLLPLSLGALPGNNFTREQALSIHPLSAGVSKFDPSSFMSLANTTVDGVSVNDAGDIMIDGVKLTVNQVGVAPTRSNTPSAVVKFYPLYDINMNAIQNNNNDAQVLSKANLLWNLITKVENGWTHMKNTQLYTMNWNQMVDNIKVTPQRPSGFMDIGGLTALRGYIPSPNGYGMLFNEELTIGGGWRLNIQYVDTNAGVAMNDTTHTPNNITYMDYDVPQAAASAIRLRPMPFYMIKNTPAYTNLTNDFPGLIRQMNEAMVRGNVYQGGAGITLVQEESLAAHSSLKIVTNFIIESKRALQYARYLDQTFQYLWTSGKARWDRFSASLQDIFPPQTIGWEGNKFGVAELLRSVIVMLEYVNMMFTAEGNNVYGQITLDTSRNLIDILSGNDKKHILLIITIMTAFMTYVNKVLIFASLMLEIAKIEYTGKRLTSTVFGSDKENELWNQQLQNEALRRKYSKEAVGLMMYYGFGLRVLLYGYLLPMFTSLNNAAFVDQVQNVYGSRISNNLNIVVPQIGNTNGLNNYLSKLASKYQLPDMYGSDILGKIRGIISRRNNTPQSREALLNTLLQPSTISTMLSRTSPTNRATVESEINTARAVMPPQIVSFDSTWENMELVQGGSSMVRSGSDATKFLMMGGSPVQLSFFSMFDWYSRRSGLALSDIIYTYNSTFNATRLIDIVSGQHTRETVRYIVSELVTKPKVLEQEVKDGSDAVKIFIELNITPVNVNSLQRIIPLSNIYNYSYSLDRFVFAHYDISTATLENLYKYPDLTLKGLADNLKDPNDAAALVAADSSASVVFNKTDELLKIAFLKMIINPYCGIDTAMYGLPTSVFAFLGPIGRIMRGTASLGMGTPKFISDQVLQKALLNSLYLGDKMGDTGLKESMGHFNRFVKGLKPGYSPYGSAQQGLPVAAVGPSTSSGIQINTNNLYTREDKEVFETLSYFDPSSKKVVKTNLSQLLGSYAPSNETNTATPGSYKLLSFREEGYERFNTQLVRTSFFITNLQRFYRLAMSDWISRAFELVSSGHRMVAANVTEMRMGNETQGPPEKYNPVPWI